MMSLSVSPLCGQGSTSKKDARFSYPGFGTWSLRSRKARKIRNPQTNEMMKPASPRATPSSPTPSCDEGAAMLGAENDTLSPATVTAARNSTTLLRTIFLSPPGEALP